MAHGSRLTAHASRLVAQGSWLMAKKNLRGIPQALGPRAKFFLAASSHEPWGMSHEPWTTNR